VLLAFNVLRLTFGEVNGLAIGGLVLVIIEYIIWAFASFDGKVSM